MTSYVGIAAFEYHEPLSAVVKRTLERGVTTCELATPGDITRVNLQESRQLLEDYRLRVTAVASLTKLNSTDDVQGTLATLEESIDLAEALDCPSVITYFGGHESRGRDEGIARYASLCKQSVARAADKGVNVLIENHFSHAPGEVTNSPDGCVDLIEAVDSPAFGLNFDHCNFAIGGVDIVSAYERLRPFIRNVHVKDARPVDRVKDEGYKGRIVTDVNNGDFLFVPVGEGITDNAEILQRVVNDALGVPVTVEVHMPDELLDDAFDRGIELCRSKGVR